MDFLIYSIIPAYLVIGGIFWALGIITKKSEIRSRRQRLLAENTIIAEYTPPPNLRPGEIAYLYDQSVDTQEYLSTLFDLELRGYLTLTPGSSPGLIRATATDKKVTALMNYESELYYTAIRAETNMKHYGSWTERLWGSQFDNLIDLDLQQKGLLNPIQENTTYTSRMSLGLMGFALLWCMFFVIYGDGIQTYEDLDKFLTIWIMIFIFAGLVVLTVPFIAFGYRVFKKARRLAKMTDALEELWPELEGYRRYVAAVELNRIQFKNKDQEELALNEAQPYAIAFNLDTKWQDRFKTYS